MKLDKPLQALELMTFVVGDLVERLGSAPHPEAGFKLAGLMLDVAQEIDGLDLDFPIMVEVLTDRLTELADGRWEYEQDPDAEWVPDDPLSYWCPRWGLGLRNDL